ncbi:MAG: hypothetical protein LAT67_02145 [Balneolales bacterium]|nr:hypothetical protein [Balneolales bacterium]
MMASAPVFNTAFATDSNERYAPGFVITIDADTLRGDILLTSQFEHHWRLNFRKQGESEFVRYRPEEVYSYFFDSGDEYFSIAGDFGLDGMLNLFMIERMDGSLKLYSTMLDRERTVFFVRHRDGRLIYLQPDLYIPQLESLFAECGGIMRPEPRAQRRFRYTEEGITNAMNAYFACTGEEDRIVGELERVRPERTNSFGIFAGYNTSNSRVTAYDRNLYAGVAFDYIPGFTAGAFFDIPITRWPVFFRPELTFATRGGNAEVPFPGIPPETILTEDEIEFRFSYVTANMMLRYEYALAGIFPYFNFGPVIAVTVYERNIVSRDVFTADDEVVTRSNRVIPFVDDLNFGLNFGTGVRIPVGSTSIFLEGKYIRIFSNIDDGSHSFRTTALEFTTGISF